jgi:hypothetical protein
MVSGLYSLIADDEGSVNIGSLNLLNCGFGGLLPQNLLSININNIGIVKSIYNLRGNVDGM